MRLRWLHTVLFLTLFVPTASADTLTIPTDITVFGKTDVFSGPSFVVSGAFGATDWFALTADGTVDLASGRFTANAAGVIVAPGSTNTGNSPGQTATAPASAVAPGFPYASLLIGNGDLGYFPVFMQTQQVDSAVRRRQRCSWRCARWCRCFLASPASPAERRCTSGSTTSTRATTVARSVCRRTAIRRFPNPPPCSCSARVWPQLGCDAGESSRRGRTRD